MQVVSMTEARNNFKDIFDSVYLDNDEVIIHRKGRENVVIISFEKYNYMKEKQKLQIFNAVERTKDIDKEEFVEKELVE